jgi:hypothetical protein
MHRPDGLPPSAIGRLIGFALCAPLIVLPLGSAAHADPKVVRTKSGLDVTEYFRVGSCAAKGPFRLGPPAGVPAIRYSVAVTLTILGQKGCKPRQGSYALIWQFSVPKPVEKPKVLIIYVKRGLNAHASAAAYLLK